jgi:hypothetical protein
MSAMKIPEWTKPGIWGAIIGSIMTMVVGFSYMGWSSAGTTERIASDRAAAAVVSALVPYCTSKAMADPDLAKMAKLKAETSSYSRSDMVRTAGWATLPGMTTPNSALADACSTKLQTASAN